MNFSFPHPSPWVSAIFQSTIDKYLKFQVKLSCSEIKYDYFLVLKQSLYRVVTNHKIEFVSCSKINHKIVGRRLHKLEKLVSDPYLLYLANKNMFKLNHKIELVWCRSKVQNRACMVSQQSTKQSLHRVATNHTIELVSCSNKPPNRYRSHVNVQMDLHTNVTKN